jgi:hypothetical protein
MRFPAPDKIKFLAVVKGSCWVWIEGEPDPLQVGPGDVGLLAAKRSFVLSSHPDLEPVEAMEVFRRSSSNMAHLGQGEDFHYLGGHLLLDPASRELLQTPCLRGSTFLPPHRWRPRFSGCWTTRSRALFEPAGCESGLRSISSASLHPDCACSPWHFEHLASRMVARPRRCGHRTGTPIDAQHPGPRLGT